MTSRRPTLVTTLVFCSLWLAQASPSKAETGAEIEVQSARACPQVFGSNAVMQANKRQRTIDIRRLEIQPYRVTLVHSVGRWQVPVVPTHLRKIKIKQIKQRDGERVAVVALTGDLELTCGGSLFLVAENDALGKSARVLAVLDEGLLIENNKALSVVTLRTRLPRLETIWTSPFILVPAGASPSSGRAASRRTASNRSSPTSMARPGQSRADLKPVKGSGAIKNAKNSGTRAAATAARSRAKERTRGSTKR